MLSYSHVSCILIQLNGIVALFWKMEKLGGDFKSRHDYIFSASPDLDTVAAFHLNNQEAKYELKVHNSYQLLLFCPTLGKLDHVLSPSSSIAQKISFCITLMRQLEDLGWGAGAKTMHTVALSLSTQQLSAAHQSGVAALTFIL